MVAITREGCASLRNPPPPGSTGKDTGWTDVLVGMLHAAVNILSRKCRHSSRLPFLCVCGLSWLRAKACLAPVCPSVSFHLLENGHTCLLLCVRAWVHKWGQGAKWMGVRLGAWGLAPATFFPPCTFPSCPSGCIFDSHPFAKTLRDLLPQSCDVSFARILYFPHPPKSQSGGSQLGESI